MANYVMRNGRRIEVEVIETGDDTPRRRRAPETFAQVPLEWAAKAAKATNTRKALVWIELLYAVWLAKSETVTLSTVRLDVSHQTKCRALRELEAVGLVKVEWRARKAPLVRLKLKPDA